MTMRQAPDPRRLGGIAWLEHTRGSMTSAERRRLIPAILRGQAQAIASRIALITRWRRAGFAHVPIPPDSVMARLAEEAAADQPAALLAHACRTWAFGRALAAVDGATGLDDELFYIAALLHDVGLIEAVTGEDFTLRSAAAAAPIVAAYRPHDLHRVRDAIAAHATPGATVERDGPEAFYIQTGATCDLVGLRLHHLSTTLIADVLAQLDRTGLADDIIPRIKAEADAVPDGRFAQLRQAGFTLGVRLAPLPD